MAITLEDYNKPVTSGDIFEISAGATLNFDIVGGSASVFRRLLSTQTFVKVTGADFTEGAYSDVTRVHAHYKFEFSAPVIVIIGHGAKKIN